MTNGKQPSSSASAGGRHRLNSDMSSQGAGHAPPLPRANTVSSIIARPYSPLSKRLASSRLAGIIERHQQRERSCTPSPSPLTPSSLGLAQNFFSFPDESVPKSSSAVGSSVSDSGSSTTVTTSTVVATVTASKPEVPLSSDGVVGSGEATSRVQTSSGIPWGSGAAEREDQPFSRYNPREGADGGTISRSSTVSTSSSFTYESFEPSAPKNDVESLGREASNPAGENRSSSLEKPEKPVVPQTANVQAPKSQVVYRPIDVTLAQDITYVPGGYFDASQPNEDFEETPRLRGVVEMMGSSRGVAGVLVRSKSKGEDVQGREKEKKSKEKKSIFRLSKRSKDDKDKSEDGGQTESKSSSLRRKEPDSKQGSRRGSKAMSEASPSSSNKDVRRHSSDVVSPSRMGILPSSKPPLPTTLPSKSHAAKPKKRSSEHAIGVGFVRGSLPDLTSPSRSIGSDSLSTRSSRGSTRSSRDSTPDIMGLEGDAKTQRRGSKSKRGSLTRRLSQSIQNLVRDSKRGKVQGEVARNNPGPTLLSFRKLSTDDSPVFGDGLVSARSELQLAAMTDRERKDMLEDTEVVPRAYSLECLLPQHKDRSTDKPPHEQSIDRPLYQERSVDFEERSVDGPRITRPPKPTIVPQDSSDSEYETCSDSESIGGFGHPSISIISQPSDDLSSEVGYASRNTSTVAQETSSSYGCKETETVLSAVTVSSYEKSKAKVDTLSNYEQSGKTKTGSRTPFSNTAAQPLTSSSSASSTKVKQNISVTSRKASPKVQTPEKQKKESTKSAPRGILKKQQQAAPTKPSTPASNSGRGQASNITDRLSAERNSGRGQGTFTRFSKDRVPVRKPGAASPRAITPSGPSSGSPSPRSSTRTPSRLSAGSSSSPVSSRPRTPVSPLMVDRVERIKQQRKSDSQGITPVTKSIHQKATNSPLATKRSVSTSATPSVSSLRTSGPKKLANAPPLKTSAPGTPQARRRKLGMTTPSPVASPKLSPERKKKGPSPKVSKSNEKQKRRDSDMGLDVNELLSSVGERLDLLSVSPPVSETGSGSDSDYRKGAKRVPELDLGPKPTVVKDTKLKPKPKLLPVDPLPFSPPPTTPPPLASMAVDIFAPFSPSPTSSSTHSRQSSLDISEVRPPSPVPQITITPDNSPIFSRRKEGESNPAASDKSKGQLHSILKKSISATHVTPLAAKSVKVKLSTMDAPEKQKVVPLKTTPSGRLAPAKHLPTNGRVSLTPHTPVATPRKTESVVQKNLPSTGKATREMTPSYRRVSSPFTSSLPPRPPSVRKNVSESQVKRVSSCERPVSTPADRAKPLTRPLSASPLRSSMRKTSAGIVSSLATTPVNPLKSRASVPSIDARGSSARSSGRTKKSSTQSVPKHSTEPGSLDRKIVATKSATNLMPLRREGSARRMSLRAKSSSQLRPMSSTAPRKSSVSSASSKDSRGSGSSLRQSMRRVSSGDILGRKMIKPGANATLTRERKPSHVGTNLSASMRLPKSGTNPRPRSGSVFVRNTNATMSLRVSKPPSFSRRVSTGTLPRTSTLGRKPTPPSSVAGSIQSSPVRVSMRRKSSAKDVFAVFDQISADVQGSM